MTIKQAFEAIEKFLIAKTGSMGKIICQRELLALKKKEKDLKPEDVDVYIKRIVKAITSILGQKKAQELGKEINTVAITIIYGGKGATKTDGERSFQVMQAFFIKDDGRLLAHTSASEAEDLDSDIVSSMLTAVQGFIADSLGRGESGALDELKFGNTTILMARKGKTTMAVVVAGEQFAPVRHYMEQAVDEVVEHYASILETWDGDMTTITGIKYYTDVLCMSGPVLLKESEMPEMDTEEEEEEEEPASKEQVKAPQKTVSFMREIEFYGGYVRVKVGVKNHMSTVVTNVALKLTHNETALRLDRLEPKMEVKGSEVVLGNIGAHEKKSFAIYLDPIICMDSYVDGYLTYRDAQGALETVKMKRKLVSIVCPMLYTEEEINTAMLKRMIKEELTHQDSRYYKNDKVDWETTLEVLKGALGRHDIRKVREIHWDEEPKSLEVWYYAQIKGRKDHMVVRISIWKERKTFLLFVASESLLIVTGFLAELRHDISKELEKRGLMPGTFIPIFEHEATAIVGRGPPLIMKVSEAEIDPVSTEQR